MSSAYLKKKVYLNISLGCHILYDKNMLIGKTN